MKNFFGPSGAAEEHPIAADFLIFEPLAKDAKVVIAAAFKPKKDYNQLKTLDPREKDSGMTPLRQEFYFN